jgi:thiol-disulfide isomerase/thioredoxin
MISTGDNFRKTFAKRCLAACLVAFCALGTLSAQADDAKAPKKAAAKTAKKVKVIEFSAKWCVPCKVFAPIYSKLKSQFKNDVAFDTVDTDTEEGDKLVNKYGMSGLPAIVIIDKDDKVTYKKSGIQNMTEVILTAELKKALGK